MAIAGLVLAIIATGPVVAQDYGPQLPPRPGRTPVETLNRQYAERYGPRVAGPRCTRPTGSDIVVCGDASGAASPYRVPLPDDRFAEGERVIRSSEPPAATRSTAHCNRPGCAEPSKLMETIGKVVTALKGEEPR